MKKIAVITGASSGMGQEFVRTVNKLNVLLDEVWVIARREERLKKLDCPYKIKVLAMDLTIRENLYKYADELKKEDVSIALLINASGYGKLDAMMDIDLETNLNMVDLNVQALQAMCQISIPYMEKGSKIINISSLAAYQPTPYLNVYAASKAFVLSYSRGLNQELKKKGIHVMALCPFWTKTEFFNRAVSKNIIVKNYVALYETKDVINKAWKALLKNKDVTTYGFVSYAQILLTKILPHSIIMFIWKKQQKLK